MTIIRASGWKQFLIALVAVFFSGIAIAQPLDDVALQYSDEGVVATIKLTGPVLYLRHFPERQGKFLEIYYDRAPGAAADERWVDNEVRNSPPHSRIPSFSVTTRDQQSKPKLVVEFSREAEYSVSPGKDGRSLLLTIKPDRAQVSIQSVLPRLPVIRREIAPAANADPDVVATNQQARELMIKGRDALESKNDEEAVQAFNQLLLLMPNDYTQDAQEWVGVARERAGQTGKAKLEYGLYLKLYPVGEGAGWVRQRLAGLEGKASEAKLQMEGSPDKKETTRLITFGGVSSRYYYGKSSIDTTYELNNTTTTDSYSATDQSMLVTNVDASSRYLSEEYDGRLVFRDAMTKNFLSSQSSTNRIYAAYAELKGRKQNYLIRAGRQSSSGAGILGRFDGVSGGYGAAEDWRINASVGALTDFSDSSRPTFIGSSVDRGPYSVFFVNQRVEGMLDRRALGGEYRYFETDKTGYALLDYDIYFRTLNTAMFMGTLTLDGSTTYNLMFDHRKSPTMSIRTALNGATTSSLDALSQSIGADALRDLAKARTATSNYGQLGVTRALTKQWQVGGDIKLSTTSGLAASGSTTGPEGYVDATDGTGLDKTVSGQVIGSNLFREQDIWSASLSLSKSDLRNGRSFYLFNHLVFGGKWMVDTSWQYYWQDDRAGGKLTRNSPMVRTSYQLRDNFSVDADVGLDFTNTSGPISSSKEVRKYFSTGLRWDF